MCVCIQVAIRSRGTDRRAGSQVRGNGVIYRLISYYIIPTYASKLISDSSLYYFVFSHTTVVCVRVQEVCTRTYTSCNRDGGSQTRSYPEAKFFFFLLQKPFFAFLKFFNTFTVFDLASCPSYSVYIDCLKTLFEYNTCKKKKKNIISVTHTRYMARGISYNMCV